MQYCPSCGKGVEAESAFCPYCGHSLVSPVAQTAGAEQPAAATPAQAPIQEPTAAPVQQQAVPLTSEQMAMGGRGLTSALLNFLFWGSGYYRSEVQRPFGRSWLLWPVIYVVYAFIFELVAFSGLISTAGSPLSITVGTSGVIATGGNPSYFDKDIAIAALVVLALVIGLFLARDVYSREAASSGGSMPSFGAAVSSAVDGITKQVNVQGIEANPSPAFSILGGVLLILGSLYTTLDESYTSHSFGTGGIKDLELGVLAVLVIYLAVASGSRPSWRVPAGLFIIAIAVVDLSLSTEYVVELGACFALIGGGLVIASGLRERGTRPA